MFQYRLATFALGLIIVVMTGLAVSVRASSHGAFNSEETTEIERIVRDYIRKNPEIILEALQELEERRRLAGAEQARQQIALNREALIDDPGSPVGGNPEGDVTIVEFFDYRCPYCKAVTPQLTRLLKEDTNIRFVYKEWPILGPVSVVGSRAALAARNQGKYTEFHDRLMGSSGQLNEQRIFQIAEDLGLDMDRLRSDMGSPKIDDILRRNNELASKLQITGTPAFVIGEALVPGAVELSDLKALVMQARTGG